MIAASEYINENLKDMEVIQVDNPTKVAVIDKAEWSNEMAVINALKAELKSELEKMSNDRDAFQESARINIEELNAERAKNEASQIEYERRIMTFQNDANSLLNQIAKNEITIAKMASESKINLTTITAKFKAYKKDADEELERARGAASASGNLRAECESLAFAKRGLEEELERAKASITKLEIEKEATKCDVNNATDKQLKSHRDDLQMCSASFERDISAIEIEKGVLLEKCSNMGGEIEEVQRNKHEAEEALQELHKEVENRVKNLVTFHTNKLAVNNLILQKESLDQINEAKNELVTTEQNLKSVQEKLNDTEISLNKKLEYAEHDPNVLGQLLAETKIELALQKCENEELQQSYRRLERDTCNLKLTVASMLEERDDMNAMKAHVASIIDTINTPIKIKGPRNRSSSGISNDATANSV